jgi:hypothetical protein
MRYNPAGVVVHDDDRGSVGHNGRAVNFARVAKNCVQQAGGDQKMPHNVPAGVQHKANKGFHVRIVARVGGDVLAPVVGRVVGILGFAVGGRFPER